MYLTLLIYIFFLCNNIDFYQLNCIRQKDMLVLVYVTDVECNF